MQHRGGGGNAGGQFGGYGGGRGGSGQGNGYAGRGGSEQRGAYGSGRGGSDQFGQRGTYGGGRGGSDQFVHRGAYGGSRGGSDQFAQRGAYGGGRGGPNQRGYGDNQGYGGARGVGRGNFDASRGRRPPVSQNITRVPLPYDIDAGNEIEHTKLQRITFNAIPFEIVEPKRFQLYEIYFSYLHANMEIDLCRISESGEFDLFTDVARNIRRGTIQELFILLMAYLNRDTSDTYLYIYDRARKLYTDNYGLGDVMFQLETAGLGPDALADIRHVTEVAVTITFTGTEFDVSSDGAPVLSVFFETLFQQTQFEAPDFLFYNGKVFDLATSQLLMEQGGSSLSVIKGHHKNVEFLRQGESTAAVAFINPKQALFYTQGSLADTIAFQFGLTDLSVFTINQGLDQVNEFIRKLVVYLEYAETRRFTIRGLSNTSSEDQTFLWNGQEISVCMFIEQHYHRNIKHPDWPCVIERRRVDGEWQNNYYPLECVMVYAGQRVPRTKVNNQEEAQYIRKCQLQPTEMMQAVRQQADRIRLSNENVMIPASGINVFNILYDCEVSVLDTPEVFYRNTAKQIADRSSEWRLDKDQYVIPAKRKFVLFVCLGRCTQDSGMVFAERLIARAVEFGIQIENHDVIRPNIQNSTDLIDCLRDVTGQNPLIDYIFLLGDCNGAHHALKASEVDSKVVTQQIMDKTLAKLGDVSLTNILNKMNLKAGGLNQELSLPITAHNGRMDFHKSFFAGCLVMAIDKSSGSPTLPTHEDGGKMKRMHTYGYAYSTTDSANVTHGGYFYTTQEMPPLPENYLEQIFNKAYEDYFKKQGKYPIHVLYIRKGDAERNDYQLLDECEILRGVFDRMSQDSKKIQTPGMLFLSLKRRHNIRMAVESCNNYSNVPPGTCIGDVFSRKNEFVIVPHTSPLGTARPFTVTVYDDRWEAPVEAVKQATLNLCYNFEIVTKSINIPAPLRCAAQFADRGRNNFNIKSGECLPEAELPGLTDRLNVRIDTRYTA